MPPGRPNCRRVHFSLCASDRCSLGTAIIAYIFRAAYTICWRLTAACNPMTWRFHLHRPRPVAARSWCPGGYWLDPEPFLSVTVCLSLDAAPVRYDLPGARAYRAPIGACTLTFWRVHGLNRPGAYVTAGIEMLSGVTLVVRAFASINASTTISDWRPRRLVHPPCAVGNMPAELDHGVLGGLYVFTATNQPTNQPTRKATRNARCVDGPSDCN